MINIFLPGVDWKLYFHGRVFYERNCYEGELCNVWCNKSFSLKCVDAFIPSLLWLFHHKVALLSYFLLILKGIFICFYCLLSVTRFAFIENKLVNARDTFTAAGIFLGFIISIISHHTFAIFYTMYPRVPHSFYFDFVSSDRLSKWMCQRVVTMKQLLPVWWMMCFLLYRRPSGKKAQSSNPELKISEYPMAQYSESRIFMYWTVVWLLTGL